MNYKKSRIMVGMGGGGLREELFLTIISFFRGHYEKI